MGDLIFMWHGDEPQSVAGSGRGDEVASCSISIPGCPKRRIAIRAARREGSLSGLPKGKDIRVARREGSLDGRGGKR